MKPVTHSKITEIALEIYQKNNSSFLSKAIDEVCLRKALIKGSKIEDRCSCSRAKNWHFYAANPELEGYVHVLWPFPRITIKPTSGFIVKERQEMLNSSLNTRSDSWLFTFFGRILHHIQDMSTPSHVIPIYHGLIVSDPYEKYLVSQWIIIAELIRKKFKVPTEVLEEPYTTFVDLYQNAANRLLEFLRSEKSSFPVKFDSEMITGSSELLWKPYDPTNKHSTKGVLFKIRGFGKFGIVGQQFGNNTPFELNGNVYQVKTEVYRWFAEKFVSSAVADTLRALHLFNRILKNK
ncbi:hypothetical protein K8T06_05290 [bacterium]|nr:hypothetical protein [bacterium]